MMFIDDEEDEVAAPPQKDAAGLPPPAIAKPPVQLEEQDHSYLTHNPWRDIAQAAKRKRLSLWPDYD